VRKKLRDVLPAVREKLPPRQPGVAFLLGGIASFEFNHRNYPEAWRMIYEAIEIGIEVALTHPQLLAAMDRIAREAPAAGLEAETHALFHRVLEAVAPDRDFLNETSRRPPIEARPFTTATRALRYYGAKSRTGAVSDRARRLRAWLAASRPFGTEDCMFRISGLKYADASPGEVEAAARARWRPIKVTWAGPGLGENPQGACQVQTSEL